FLEPHAPLAMSSKVCGLDFKRSWDAVKHAAGFNGKDTATTRVWVSDYMRHTGISMHLVKHENEGKTASWAGNSPDIIHKHYKGLVKAKDCAEFWSISPENLGAEIIQLNTKAA